MENPKFCTLSRLYLTIMEALRRASIIVRYSLDNVQNFGFSMMIPRVVAFFRFSL